MINCCPSSSVRSYVRLSVNFSNFHLLLQNYYANSNQTCHISYLGKKNESLYKYVFPLNIYYLDNSKIVKIDCRQLKSLNQNHWTNFKLSKKHPQAKTVHVCQNKRKCALPRRKTSKMSKQKKTIDDI